jgi:hypothetical protein
MSNYIENEAIVFVWNDGVFLVDQSFKFIVKTLHHLLLRINLSDVGNLAEILRNDCQQINLN